MGTVKPDLDLIWFLGLRNGWLRERRKEDLWSLATNPSLSSRLMTPLFPNSILPIPTHQYETKNLLPLPNPLLKTYQTNTNPRSEKSDISKLILISKS